MAEMTREQVYEWLRGDERPRWGRLATNGRRGFPHVVPLGYFLVGDDIVVPARGQRLANARRDPKVCFTVDSGTQMADLKGAVLQGTAQVVEDDAARLELAREGARRRGVAEDELPTEVRPGQCYLRFRPEHIASWDNARR